jgi:hypothetical protein
MERGPDLGRTDEFGRVFIAGGGSERNYLSAPTHQTASD